MFAYCGNDPACHKDASGHVQDYIREENYWGVYVVVAVAACVVIAANDSGETKEVADNVISYVQQILEIGKELVRRDQTVYVMCYTDEATYGKNKVGYVGRTNDLKRRTREHKRDRSKDKLKNPTAVATGLTKNEAVVFEQILISAFTLDDLINRRREIGIKNLADVIISDRIIALQEGFVESELLCMMER